MDAVTVTVLRSGWWLPGRALKEGEAIALDTATAEALARRGIVRLPDAEPETEPQRAASDAGKAARKRAKKED